MGFETQNTAKPVKWLKVISEKQGDTILGKFFQLTEKKDGKYVPILMKNATNYPLPFHGYLLDIKVDTEATYKDSTGKIIPAPNVKFSFTDDDNENYILQLPFTNNEGRVNSMVSTMLNSLANIKTYGLIKLSIIKNESQKNGKTEINFNLTLRHDKDWVSGSKDFFRFAAPKDGGEDKTKASWKYDFKTNVPPTMIKKMVDGEEVEIKNHKKHQQFYLDVIEKDILPNLGNVNYKIPTQSQQTTTAPSNVVYEEEGGSNDEILSDDEWSKKVGVPKEEPKTSKPKTNAEKIASLGDDSDMPF